MEQNYNFIVKTAKCYDGIKFSVAKRVATRLLKTRTFVEQTTRQPARKFYISGDPILENFGIQTTTLSCRVILVWKEEPAPG